MIQSLSKLFSFIRSNQSILQKINITLWITMVSYVILVKVSENLQLDEQIRSKFISSQRCVWFFRISQLIQIIQISTDISLTAKWRSLKVMAQIIIRVMTSYIFLHHKMDLQLFSKLIFMYFIWSVARGYQFEYNNASRLKNWIIYLFMINFFFQRFKLEFSITNHYLKHSIERYTFDDIFIFRIIQFVLLLLTIVNSILTIVQLKQNKKVQKQMISQEQLDEKKLKGQ